MSIIAIDSMHHSMRHMKSLVLTLPLRNWRTLAGITWIYTFVRVAMLIIRLWRWACWALDTIYFLSLSLQSLKYWRFRMYLLPKDTVVNKIVNCGCQRCDIFTDAVVDNTRDQIEDFVRLIENISKLRRQICRKARVSWLWYYLSNLQLI